MAEYTAYAPFTVNLSNFEQYQFALSIFPDGYAAICPVDAASVLGITYPYAGPSDSGVITFPTPMAPGYNIGHPLPSGVLLDDTILTNFVPGQASPLYPSLTGPDLLLVWSMTLIYQPEYTDADPTEFAPIPKRRWAMGWEGSGDMEITGSSGTGARARDASRTAEGFGLKLRGESVSTTINVPLAQTDATGVPSHDSWERFYIRVRNLGSITGGIWRTRGSTNSGGAFLQIQTDGSITVNAISTTNVILATFGTIPALVIDQWYKIDCIVKYGTGAAQGTIRVYVNGVLTVSGSTAVSGLGDNQNHNSTDMLSLFSGTSTWEIDIDDWHNAEIPNIGGVETLNSIDFVIGTHVLGTNVESVVSSTGWTGNSGFVLDSYPNPTGSGSTMDMDSIIAGSIIELLTTAIDGGNPEEQFYSGIYGGACSFSVAAYGTQAGGVGNNGLIGYLIQGGAAVTGTAAMSAVAGAVTRAYLNDGTQLQIYSIAPLSIQYIKGGLVNPTVVMSLAAFVQYQGLWGYEDVPADSAEMGALTSGPTLALLHNCRYPGTIWSIVGPPPDAPVCVIGGTYTGNGTFQEVELFLPCHLLIIRNITTASIGPLIMNTTQFGPSQGTGGPALVGDVVRMFYDFNTDTFKFRVTGASNRSNQAAQTYQYIAFCDPGLRFMVNGEINHGSSTATWVNNIIDSNFTPEWGFFMTGPASGSIWVKSAGMTAQQAVTAAGVNVTAAAQFGTGTFDSGDSISESTNCTAYSFLRTVGDTCENIMVQTATYTGNGLTSQVVSLTPVSTRFPLAVFVARRGGSTAVHYRDASHTGANSCSLSSGANTATGITSGAIDSITVGSTLNVNGAVYDVLCFPGDLASWTNGTFYVPNCSVPGDFWEPPPEEVDPGIAILGDGGLILGDTNIITLLQDISGIYTIVPGKLNDTLYDRQTGQSSVDVAIPDPTFKTGYIGG